MYVECDPASTVYDAPLPIGEGFEDIPRDEIHFWYIAFESRELAEHYIARRQAVCQRCICTNLGEMTPLSDIQALNVRVPVIGGGGEAMYLQPACPDEQAVAVCKAVYRCYCFARLLRQDRIAKLRGVPGDEIRQALNQISNTVKMRNPGWEYRKNPGDAESFRWDPIDSHESNNYRRLAPGTKEPYFIEGPDQLGFGQSWTWLQGLKGVGLGLKKREDSSGAAPGVEKTCNADGDAEDGDKNICAVEGERKDDGNSKKV
ncbi:hypothetical protein AA313_de0207027 [Arthrobotrys entomopaga]|nr:hypothetical protein AA313_de0207027 [Arthrobotrys entomopaga]